MKDVIGDEEEIVDENSPLPNESLKKQTQEHEKIAEDDANEKCAQVKDIVTQMKQNDTQSHEKNIEIDLILFNDATNNKTDKEILVDGTENIVDFEGNTLIVLPQETNGICTPLLETVHETNILKVSSTEEVTHEDKSHDFTSVIEISEDGTWDTAELPTDNIKKIKSQNVQTNESQNVTQESFTSIFPGSEINNKHTNTHSVQYYINSPVESIKPTKHEKDLIYSECQSEKARNIGAQIMEKYDEERQKIKDSKNLPDVSLLDVEDSLEDIQRERRKIIESQAVRAKRIDSWIKGGSVIPPKELEKMDLMDDQKGRDQQSIDVSSIEHTWSQDTLATQLVDYTTDGEVVYDSILENKQKTKTFWEQLMLASNVPSEASLPLNSKADLQQINSNNLEDKVLSDTSDQEFYDAQPYCSLSTPPEVEEGIDGPKIVEVSKKMVRTVDSKISMQTEDSGFEAENKVHSEKDVGLGEERERNIFKLKSQAESKIVLEMREMKEREDEWRRHQMSFQTSLSSVGTGSSFKEDEAFISIPTTDEGNYSEYGSEEKEENSLCGINRMMSPEVSVNQNVTSIGFQHHRTQSLDSMSSGHSSGSGSVAQLDSLSIVNRSGRRGITVKPLDEPEDDDISTFIWGEKETPIEREIRLSCEREEELRREKSICLPFKDTPSPITPKEPLISADGKKLVETPKRLATKRIENEIEQAKKREKELKKGHTEKEIEPNNEMSKPTENKTDIKNTNIKNGISTSKQNKTTAINSKILNVNISSTPISIEPKEVANNVQNKLYFSNNNFDATPKRFQPNPNQKGLMKRFLASRGKISSGFTFSSNNVLPSHNPTSAPVSHPPSTDTFFIGNNTGENHDGKTENSTHGSRPGYTSAEDKIQFELMEMRKREEELRQERSRLMARSQPDLLSIVDDEQLSEKKCSKENDQDNDNPNKLPPMAKLRTALSNPYVLDIDNKQPSAQRTQKRRSALIEEWEDRIQKNHNNE